MHVAQQPQEGATQLNQRGHIKVYIMYNVWFHYNCEKDITSDVSFVYIKCPLCYCKYYEAVTENHRTHSPNWCTFIN